MALSRTEIANRALDAIGADSIGSINDQNKPAKLCNRLLTALRDDLLRRHPWNFAIARATLPALTTNPAWGFAYAYQKPTDYLRILTIDTFDPTTPFQVEGETIVTNLSGPLRIKYIQKVEDVARFDPMFTSVLVLALARDLAKPIANDTSLRAQLSLELDRALRDARSADAAEGLPDVLWANTLIDARLI